MTSPRGQFITLEGGEGVGKSTQLKRLQEALNQKGIPCLITREPGGTPFGERIRPLFLQEILEPEVELLLILAMRRHHITQVIQPALTQGVWVICDRFIDSSVVYQGFARNQEPLWIYQWHQWSGITLAPDLTFIFQEEISMALSRRQNEGKSLDKFDEACLEFHQKVALGYREVAKRDAHRCICLPPCLSVIELTHLMMKHIEQRLC